MNLWNKLTGFFNRKERREQEKEVKAQDRKWWQFWKRKEAEPEPGEVMPEEPEAPWRVDSQALMDEAEKNRIEEEERREKEEDLRQKEEERIKARETLNTRWGLNWTQEDYNNFWDTFGYGDLIDYFGSDIIMAYTEGVEKGMDARTFLEIARQVMKDCEGLGLNQEQAGDRLFDAIRAWQKPEEDE